MNDYDVTMADLEYIQSESSKYPLTLADCRCGCHGDYNSGNYNSGNYNSGNYNSGDRNSGIYNSGDRNSGDWNSGDWNSCNRESGFFNSTQPETVRAFNKPCLLSDWEKAEKPGFLYFDIDKSIGYKGSFQKAFQSASPDDIEKLKALPNFDAEVFFEISGIRIK